MKDNMDANMQSIECGPLGDLDALDRLRELLGINKKTEREIALGNFAATLRDLKKSIDSIGDIDAYIAFLDRSGIGADKLCDRSQSLGKAISALHKRPQYKAK